MQSNFLFRVTRGLALVVAIVVAHFVIVWLFQTMKIPAPQFGPVETTLFAEPGADVDHPGEQTAAPVEILTGPATSSDPNVHGKPRG